MALVPNPGAELLRDPNLLIPGKKPIGTVKIDWSNPLTRGLRVHFLPTNHIRNLVTGKVATLHGGTFNIVNGQQCYTTDAGSSEYADVNGVSLGGLNNFTYMIIAASTTTTNNTRILTEGNSGNNTPVLAVDWEDSVRMFLRDDSNTSISIYNNDIAVNDGDIHSVGVRLTGGTYGEMFIDGGFVDALLESGLGARTFNTSALGALIKTSVSSYWSGSVYCVAGWNRALSNYEIAEFSDDPYQFLIPA